MFKTFSQKSCHLWHNMEKYGTATKGIDEKIIWSTRFTCWINKTIDIHSEYIILIAFPRQCCLHKSISMVPHYMYTACLVRNCTGFTVLRMLLYACSYWHVSCHQPLRHTQTPFMSWHKTYVCFRQWFFSPTWTKNSTTATTSIYSVIQKDGLNFVRLYFLNYTWHVNDLHNIWKRRS
jgi:hypothetical protein